jgi:hypothetical protein
VDNRSAKTCRIQVVPMHFCRHGEKVVYRITKRSIGREFWAHQLGSIAHGANHGRAGAPIRTTITLQRPNKNIMRAQSEIQLALEMEI